MSTPRVPMENKERDEPGDLPAIEGGWELVSAGTVDLWVPREPESLLEDEAALERNRFNDTMPYWAWLWDSAPQMTSALLGRGFSGEVLEVGAGLGLVGLALAQATGQRVVLSDYDPLSCAALRVNARANDLGRVEVWELDWRELPGSARPGFDAIVGCDVIYEAQAHGPLLDVFDAYLRGGGVIYLADPGRTRVPQFCRRAEARGWSVALEDAGGAPSGPEVGEYRLLTLTK